MAGRRRGDQGTTQLLLVARHTRRREAFDRELAAATSPSAQVTAAADYLRSALARTSRQHRAAAEQAAVDAVRALTAIAEQLYATATTERRRAR